MALCEDGVVAIVFVVGVGDVGGAATIGAVVLIARIAVVSVAGIATVLIAGLAVVLVSGIAIVAWGSCTAEAVEETALACGTAGHSSCR